jgi:hypothetical protein
MQITKEFLEQEIEELEAETKKAQVFIAQSQAVVNSYRMLIRRLDEEEKPPET